MIEINDLVVEGDDTLLSSCKYSQLFNANTVQNHSNYRCQTITICFITTKPFDVHANTFLYYIIYVALIC